MNLFWGMQIADGEQFYSGLGSALTASTIISVWIGQGHHAPRVTTEAPRNHHPRPAVPLGCKKTALTARIRHCSHWVEKVDINLEHPNWSPIQASGSAKIWKLWRSFVCAPWQKIWTVRGLELFWPGIRIHSQDARVFLNILNLQVILLLFHTQNHINISKSSNNHFNLIL